MGQVSSIHLFHKKAIGAKWRQYAYNWSLISRQVWVRFQHPQFKYFGTLLSFDIFREMRICKFFVGIEIGRSSLDLTVRHHGFKKAKVPLIINDAEILIEFGFDSLVRFTVMISWYTCFAADACWLCSSAATVIYTTLDNEQEWKKTPTSKAFNNFTPQGLIS